MMTVYILGSGFSASCGLPTLINLFSEILKFNRPGEDDVGNIYDALSFLYPHFRPTKPGKYPPFEEFLSLVEISEDFEATDSKGGIFDRGYWREIYKSSLRLLTDCIASKTASHGKDRPLRLFVDNLKAGDVVITFNWDTLIEKALFDKKADFNLTGLTPDSITILKLHGSLSWIHPPDNIVPKHKEGYSVLNEESRLLCLRNHDYVDSWDVTDEPPFIVAPVSSKTPLENSFLKRIWYDAFNSLISSHKIVVIGYSLPQEDYHARALIRSGILKQPLYLIDPDPAIAGKYFSTITPRITYFHNYFSGDELEDITKQEAY